MDLTFVLLRKTRRRKFDSQGKTKSLQHKISQSIRIFYQSKR